MITCPKCGSIAPDGSAACFACGTPLTEATASFSQAEAPNPQEVTATAQPTYQAPTQAPYNQPVQTEYYQNPYVQPGYSQNPYVQPAQPPYSQNPYGQPVYNQSTYGQPTYQAPTQNPYGQPVYSQNPYGQPSQPMYNQNPYGQPAYTVAPQVSKTPMILGIVGIVFAFLLAIVGHATSIPGIVLGYKEYKKNGNKTGLILSIIGETLSVISSLIGIFTVWEMMGIF